MLSSITSRISATESAFTTTRTPVDSVFMAMLRSPSIVRSLGSRSHSGQNLGSPMIPLTSYPSSGCEWSILQTSKASSSVPTITMPLR